MDQITHDIRRDRWKAVIEQCYARPEGQTIKEWCTQNNVSEKQFFYWQRRIRLQIAGEISGSLVPAATGKKQTVSFAEIPAPAMNCTPSSSDSTIDFQPEAVIRKGDLIIAVRNSISDRLLDRILEGVTHAR